MRSVTGCLALAVVVGVCLQGSARPAAAKGGVAPVASAAAAKKAIPKKAWRAHVVDCIDGDTIVVRANGHSTKIRLKGVDTPETVHPKKGVQPFGKEASRYTKNQLDDEDVWIEVPSSGKSHDQYGRLLAFVWRADGTCHNEDLILQGLARCYDRYWFDRVDDYRDAERAARKADRGMWGP
jgi:micrococcal nuclease